MVPIEVSLLLTEPRPGAGAAVAAALRRLTEIEDAVSHVYVAAPESTHVAAVIFVRAESAEWARTEVARVCSRMRAALSVPFQLDLGSPGVMSWT